MDQEQEPTPEELREALRELKKLVDAPGWKIALAMAKAQIDVRTREILFTPCAGTGQAMAQEYKKGEVQGLYLFQTMVPAAIEDYQARLEQLMEQENVEK